MKKLIYVMLVVALSMGGCEECDDCEDCEEVVTDAGLLVECDEGDKGCVRNVLMGCGPDGHWIFLADCEASGGHCEEDPDPALAVCVG